MLCFQALCQIICLFMYLFYFQKYRNFIFSGTVPDYLFIYVFLLFPEVQKGYVFRQCQLPLVSVIAFTCSSCALLLIYWAPCPIVFAGSLSFSPILSLSLSLPVDVAEYVFLSPCLVGLVSLSCHLLFLSCSLLKHFSCSCLVLFYIYLVCSSLDILFLYLFVVL